jgi:transposase
MGYTGGRSILQNFLKNEYDKKFIHKDPIVRFETDPGEQAQVDWTTIRSGRNPIYAFVMTLGYSRKTFVYFTENMGADNLILCHEKAFLFFGGVTKHILYDNMKDVVIERNKYGRGLHKFNIKLESFAKKYGFKIKLCKPYRAKTKGKVERFNSYLKSNFYRPLLIKLQDANLKVTTEVLNNYVSNWLENANNRIHGTINKKPNDVFIEELPYLITFVLDKSQIEVKRKTQQLPKITVQQSDFIEYDNLLGVVI